MKTANHRSLSLAPLKGHKTIKRTYLLLTVAMLLNGCASLFSRETQAIYLAPNPHSESSATTGDQTIALCRLQNGRGSWDAEPGTTVKVRRDGHELQVSCYDKQNLLITKSSIMPYYNTTNLWNIPLMLIPAAGIAGWVLDGVNGTSNEYPSVISVPAKPNKVNL
jgi:hypothetical protein